MEKLRDILVTDRSQADVERAKYLASLFDAKTNTWYGTAEEFEEFMSDRLHGAYTRWDLNRVLRACSWLAGKLEGYGYSAPEEFFPAALIHVTVRPPHGGSAGSVLAYKGETATVRAAGSGGYEFNRWEENGQTVSETEVYSFTAERDRELVAVFDIPPAEESGVVGLAVVGMAIVGKEIG